MNEVPSAADRWVLHVDLDAFIAAVEVLRRPELRGRPVVVGGSGDPTERTVVATASYEAREYGIRSGMPMRTAARKCPDAIFLPADGPAYDAASEQVMATLREFPAVVEVLGWDEAFLGMETSDPVAVAEEIRRAVRERTRLECTVGVGDNKLRAKLATGFGKPRTVGGEHRTFVLTRDNWYDVMGDAPTDALWGIGAKTARKLAELGYRTVAELAEADPERLAARLGPTMGPWYRTLGRGEDRSPVIGTPYVPRSRSRETTFQQNLTDWDDVRREIVRLAQRVTEDVRAEGRPAARVGVKVRFAPFVTQTRSVGLAEPTSDGAVIEAGALAALEKFDARRPVRLLGVRAEFAARSS
ncbi:MAG TPA: DNA polymerase IV [Actinopolymorphaceae bacterium]